jgi:CspA family cold shock protein
MSDNLRTGVVKFYIDEKLFGFITDDQTGEEVYVPVSGLIDEIKKNDKVTFVLSEGNKGREAIEVRIRSKKS